MLFTLHMANCVPKVFTNGILLYPPLPLHLLLKWNIKNESFGGDFFITISKSLLGYPSLVFLKKAYFHRGLWYSKVLCRLSISGVLSSSIVEILMNPFSYILPILYGLGKKISFEFLKYWFKQQGPISNFEYFLFYQLVSPLSFLLLKNGYLM